jgi:alpha-L-rhamnosidase
MNSFNHYSFGAVGEWMYSTIGGIELDEGTPAFKHVVIRPQPGGGVTSASTKLDTIAGTIATDWELTADDFRLSVSVPVNVTASVYLPFSESVREGGAPIAAEPDGRYALGSGRYELTAKTH